MQQRPAASRSAASRVRGGILHLCSALVRLSGDLRPVWVPQHKDGDIPEQVQWRLSRWFGLEHTTYKEKLREPGLFSLERRQKGNLTVICYSLMGSHEETHRKSGKATGTGTI